MNEYCVYELMTAEVVTCSPDESLLNVVKTISSKHFSCLVVVEDDIPVGIITERDLVEIFSETLNGVTWDNLEIKHFMTSPIITITEGMSLHDAVALSRSKKIRHIPVVNAGNKLVGILTQTDIIEGYYYNSDI